MTGTVLNQPRKFWMRWRVRLGYPVAVLYLLLASPTTRWIAMGAALAGIGLLIRAIAAGYLRKDRELATTGPYARTRNPLYLGSAFLAVGFAVAGHSWLAGGLVVIYFAVFYYAVMKNEESDLLIRFGVAFDAYAHSVPLFFPNFWPGTNPAPPDPEQQFSWDQYLRNREYRALIGTIAALGVLCLRMWGKRRYGI
ncbi:MAG TPA: isoprenylcysteine carboxylmethyltransferase family protein [Candidatus Acidoferrales bacterium]